MAGRLSEFDKLKWVSNVSDPRPDNNSEKAPGLGQPWWNRTRRLSAGVNKVAGR